MKNSLLLSCVFSFVFVWSSFGQTFDGYALYNLQNQNKTTISKAFVDMYFDMVEIKKRQLETSIQGISNIKQITKLYTRANTELIKYSKEYFTETAGGTNKRGMMKWNEYIYKNLRIDNLELFQVEFKY